MLKIAVFAFISQFCKVAPGEAEASSVDVTVGCDGDGVRRFDHAGQDDQERCKRFEVRLFKLDELRLHEAMGTSGLGVVDEEDFNEEDFELPTTHEVHAGEILDQTEVLHSLLLYNPFHKGSCQILLYYLIVILTGSGSNYYLTPTDQFDAQKK